MTTLSIAQKEIVHAPIGVSLQVLAAAGSGKTRVLTERISHIFQTKIKEGIIALTFTNKAAEEMLLRLNNFEGIEDCCWISTVHGVAQRILNQYGHTIGLPSELHIYDREQDCKTVFLQSLRNRGINIDEFLNVHDKKTKKEREQIIQRYMEQFSIIKRELLNENEIKEKYINSKNFWQIFVAYQEALLESGGIDFDDILVYSHRILLEQPWCGKIYRTNYKHICVDEAQDLNKAQYEFIKALCSDEITSLMMVGDPNQMIFGFNGSSNDFFCTQFVNDFNPLKFRLNENYRSSKAVIHLSNKLKPGSQIESDFALDGKRFFQNLKDEDSEASWIIDKIKELLQIKNDPEIEGDITLNNIVIIGRNKFVFKKLEECLKNNKIAYSLKKGERQVEPSSLFGKILDSCYSSQIKFKRLG
ncbi:ATP-dependent helicase [Spirobacillus cienkowskii]|uniref:ATP-dependent helicase n=1 Tax=Spirobacillus cienkowskii TaxID=495820 RepID=UPI0030CD7F86